MKRCVTSVNAGVARSAQSEQELFFGCVTALSASSRISRATPGRPAAA
ncbi:hypothetical protein ACWGI9_14855 [Streptomyces sp. NPDC054833]